MSAKGKLLTHDEVQERTRQFQALLSREKEVQTFLLKLKIVGDDEQVREKIRQHDEAIAEIHKLRHEGMLPILKELNEFIKAAKAEDAKNAKRQG